MQKFLSILSLLFFFHFQYGYGQKYSEQKVSNIDSFTILTSGMVIPLEFKNAESIIAQKWNIQFKRIAACLTPYKLQDSINKINKISNRNIENKHGKNWRKQFDAEVDIELNNIRTVAKIIDNLQFIRIIKKEIELKSGFLQYNIKPLNSTNLYSVNVEGLDIVNGKDEWFSFYRLTVNTKTKTATLNSNIKLKKKTSSNNVHSLLSEWLTFEF